MAELEETWVGQVLSRLKNEQPEKLMLEGDKQALLALAQCIREEDLNYMTTPVGRNTMLVTRKT